MKTTLKKIKSLEIQGAQNIAIACVEAFAQLLKKTRDARTLAAAARELGHARETEPAARNALKYCLLNYRENPDVAQTVINHFKKSNEKIAQIGARKIKNGMTVFTHCHASTVTNILLTAWRAGKKFTVHNTETRPKYQGRKTATE